MADEEGSSSVSDAQFIEEIAARKSEVDKLLTRKDKAGALNLCLRNPPVGTKNPEIKVELSFKRAIVYFDCQLFDYLQESNASIVDKVLTAISDAEFATIVADLDMESCDVLMKYIYRFLERGQNSATLLKCHKHLVDKAGLGSIVRVMTDRKTV